MNIKIGEDFTYYGNIADSYHLVRNNHTNQWSIYDMRNEDVCIFTWSHKPLTDPYANMSDSEIDNSTEEEFTAYNLFDECCEKFSAEFKINFTTAIEFYQACIKSGYDNKIHGNNTVFWLVDKLGRLIKEYDERYN